MKNTGYTLNTWANGHRQWYTRATFDPPLGNTPEAQRVAHRALNAAKRQTRQTIQTHDNAHPAYRFAWEICHNHEDSLGRLHGFTIGEKGNTAP
jgi:hypothetical protein